MRNPATTWALLLLASLVVARPWRRRLMRLVGIGADAGPRPVADAESVLVIGGTQFIGRATGTRLICEGRRTGGGHKTFFAEAVLTDDTGVLVAKGTGVFKRRPA